MGGSTTKRRAATVLMLLAVGLGLLTLPAEADAVSFLITGGGHGHGLGMSQWGAKGYADKGWPGGAIVQHFYSGTTIAAYPMPSYVRVGLQQNTASTTIVPSGDVTFKVGATVVAVAHANETWAVQPTSAGGHRLVRNGTVVVSSAGSPGAHLVASWNWAGGVTVRVTNTGYTYRWGPLEFDTVSTTSGYRMHTILVVSPFERYLYGLGEVPSSWPVEALKAQVLAARTYAVDKIRRMGQNRSTCACALLASTQDQAYVGYAKETGDYGARWRSAVDTVAGKVILYGGVPIQAFYSSSDGGYTENNENVWGGSPLPYLRGVHDDGDAASPDHSWSRIYTRSQLETILNARETTAVGALSNVETLAPYGVSGRVLWPDGDTAGVRITGSSGVKRVSGAALQAALGLKSTKFRITRIASYPQGVVLATSLGRFAVSDSRTPFTSSGALASWMPPAEVVTPSSLDSVAGVPQRAAKYREGTLLQDPVGGYWLASSGGKFPFASAADVTAMGYGATPLRVPWAMLDLMPRGRTLDPTARHPDGTLLKDAVGAYWWVRSGKRYAARPEVLPSWRISTAEAVPMSDADLDVPVGGDLGFRDGTLLQGSGTAVYLISNGTRRSFVSATAFNTAGYQWSNIRKVSDALVLLHPAGDSMTDRTPPPNGVLLRFADDPAKTVWLVWGGTRYVVLPQVLGTLAAASEVVTYNSALASAVPSTGVRPYRDGTLLRSPRGAVYLVSAGMLLGIRSMTDFSRMGFSTAAIRDVPYVDIALHSWRGTLDPAAAAPEGAFVRTSRSLYRIVNGKRSPVHYGPSGAVAISHGFRNGEAMLVNAATAALPEGPALLMRDGSLVRGSSGVVYLISLGQRRPFSSSAVFAAMGFSWSNVRTIPDWVLGLHALGPGI